MENSLNKTVLKNGVRILTQKIPHARSVSMGVWVNAGARDERPEQSGLSHFVEHMLFKGTRKRDACQIAREFDAIGGQSNAFTAMDCTCYHAKVLDSHVSTMVDILSDIFLHSEFNPLEVEKERAVILQEIGMVEDSPEEWVHALLLNSYWGDHPLGQSILGTRETIARFDADTLKAFLQQQYQPGHILISAAGNLEHEQVVDLIAPQFDLISQSRQLPDRLAPDIRPCHRICVRDTEQVHVCLGTTGITATDPRRYALSLLNTILGGNMSSRLFQEIREKRGLAYAVYSFAFSYEDTGMLGIYAGVAPENLAQVVDLLLVELDKFRQQPVDSAALENARQYLIGNMLLASENMDNRMSRIAQNEISFGHDIPIPVVVEAIESVTPDQVQDLAGIILAENKFAMSALGPESAVNPVAKQHIGL